MATAPCDLATLQESQGCFACFSESERLMLKIFLLARIFSVRSEQEIDINTINQDIACFRCESDAALDGFEVSILQRVAGNVSATWEDLNVGDMTPAQLRDAIRCYKCAEPKLLRAAYVYALCWVMEDLAGPQ